MLEGSLDALTCNIALYTHKTDAEQRRVGGMERRIHTVRSAVCRQCFDVSKAAHEKRKQEQHKSQRQAFITNTRERASVLTGAVSLLLTKASSEAFWPREAMRPNQIHTSFLGENLPQETV